MLTEVKAFGKKQSAPVPVQEETQQTAIVFNFIEHYAELNLELSN